MQKKIALVVVFGVVLLLAGAILSLNGTVLAQDGEGEGEPETPPFDHSVFPMLAGPFEVGSDVTTQCLLCHPDAASEIHDTIHWTWEWENPATGQTVGKQNVINNYCVSLETNEPRCTSCHVGYGWEDETFDFTSDTNVDCLVCHDTTGTYKKFPTAAGHPAYVDTEFNGVPWPAVDLGLVAQNVGPTSRETCGSCHFYGGGAAAVKHGDLDPTLVDPSHGLDVHMSADGADFTCTACHVTENHQIDGSRYDVPVQAHDVDSLVTCEACHTDMAHQGAWDSVLNMHMDTLACEACHIPTYAREMATKTWWDWSTAGQKDEDGKPMILKNDKGEVVYDTKKGDFVWEQNVVPEYVWFNGAVNYTLPDTVIDPSGPVPINTLEGSADDPNARIWPVKVFRGVQPYDSGNDIFGLLHLYPTSADDTTAYWKVYDWDLALAYAMEAAGLQYSGQYDFVETEMYWPIAHMVAPAEDALDCNACHGVGGRMDWAALGYSEIDADRLTFPMPADTAPAEGDTTDN